MWCCRSCELIELIDKIMTMDQNEKANIEGDRCPLGERLAVAARGGGGGDISPSSTTVETEGSQQLLRPTAAATKSMLLVNSADTSVASIIPDTSARPCGSKSILV